MAQTAFRFDDVEIDLHRGELLRAGKPCSVEPQVFHLLVHLVANCDRIVSVDELLDVVWNGRIVSDSTVLSRISAARAAIGDTGREQRLIKTVRKRGFRFVGLVEAVSEDEVETLGHSNNQTGPFLTNDNLSGAIEPPNATSLAVLSFEPGAGHSDLNCLATGLAAEIATELARNESMFVIAPAATMGLLRPRVDFRAIAAHLGVRYLLRGYVAKIKQQLRLNIQLHDAIDLRLVWAERFQGLLGDVFEFLNSTVVEIVCKLSAELPQIERQRALRLPKEQLQAYEYVLRGDYHHARMTRDGNNRAISMYQMAIGLDQSFAPAYAGLAWAQNHEGNQGWPKDREMAIGKAFETAGKALKLDRRLAKAHSVMGDIQLWRRQHRDSVASGFKAVECDPSHADSRMVYAYCLSMNGEASEALKQSRLALRHNPFRANRIYYSALGHACFNTQDYSGARKAALEGIRRDTKHRGLRLLHAAALAKLGELDEAKKETSTVLALDPELSCRTLMNLWPYRPSERIEEFADVLADCGLPL